MIEEENEEITELTPEKPNRRPMLIGGVAAVLLGCCAILAVVVLVLVVDPFGFNIVSRLTGRYDAAATAMPPDTSFYAGLNLLNLNPAEIDRITQPFIEAVNDPNVEDLQGAEDEIRNGVESELGIDIETDVVPWIGQYLGVGITEIKFDNFGGLDSISWVVAAEARSRDAADEFLVKLRDGAADSSGNQISEQSYEGVTVYVMQGTGATGQVAFGRSGGLVILAANLATFQAAVDAQNGDSLNESDSYRQVIGDLPRGRALTVYSNGDGIREIVEQSQNDIGVAINPNNLPLANFASSASSFSIVDAGLQVDMVSAFDKEQLSTTQQALLDAGSKPLETAAILPNETVGFLSGQRLDLLWLAIREATGDEVAFDESMASFAQEFGINPNTDIFPLMDGEWSISIIGGQSGFLSEELDVPLGISLVVETTNPTDMAASVDGIRAGIEGQLLNVEEVDNDGIISYQVSLSEDMPPAFSFGLDNNLFFLASSTGTAVKILSSGPKLSENEQYQTVLSEFSRDASLSFYLDVRTLLGTIREGRAGVELENFNDTVRGLAPLEAVALGNTYNDNIRRTQIIFFIETE